MQMSLQANSLTSCWFRQPTPTMDHPTRHAHHQNDVVSDCEDQIYNGCYVTPYDKEPMFEKPLTPSDVGKLNRLVIPKQHAEKHFPLSGFVGAGDGAETLLGFEDESGKPWRFRYSYWNSSQSYVLTKGWSRYVKEKRLDAGDVVFFERHRAEPERLFIGWRRRGAAPSVFSYNAQGYYQAQDSRGHGQQQPQLRAPAAARGGAEAATGGGGGSNSRRHVRLFGVNLECQHDSNPSTSQTTSSEAEGGNLLSTQQQQQQQQGNGYYFDYSAHQAPPSTYHSHHSYHMEMNFPQGVNWMGNGLG